jgi:hypothetical protein
MMMKGWTDSSLIYHIFPPDTSIVQQNLEDATDITTEARKCQLVARHLSNPLDASPRFDHVIWKSGVTNPSAVKGAAVEWQKCNIPWFYAIPSFLCSLVQARIHQYTTLRSEMVLPPSLYPKQVSFLTPPRM